MTDILIRICVGACGFLTVGSSVQLMAISSHGWACWCGVAIGLITILRALGVL
jgi:hypothetical protein